MNVFAVSDLHLDYAENTRWLQQLSAEDYRDDVLILAGDVSDRSHQLEWCFNELARRFRQVLYVPGNHDLWVKREKGQRDSLEKFRFIRRLAADCGIGMEPYRSGELTIVPLLGWYDYSFGQPCEQLREAWMDYFACAWPGMDDAAVNRFFLEQNTTAIPAGTVITFSHFLPRNDLMPTGIPPAWRRLDPVLGSTALDVQLRALNSRMHVYGHSHINREIEIDGVTYLNNAFGYPAETTIARKVLRCIHHG